MHMETWISPRSFTAESDETGGGAEASDTTSSANTVLCGGVGEAGCCCTASLNLLHRETEYGVGSLERAITMTDELVYDIQSMFFVE